MKNSFWYQDYNFDDLSSIPVLEKKISSITLIKSKRLMRKEA